jgi:hypothetical protein
MMCELVLACESNDDVKMSELLPQVLSLDFFQIPVTDIWQINWDYKRSDEVGWAELALSSETLAPHVMFFLALGLRSSHEPLEYILDYLELPLFLDESTSYMSH